MYRVTRENEELLKRINFPFDKSQEEQIRFLRLKLKELHPDNNMAEETEELKNQRSFIGELLSVMKKKKEDIVYESQGKSLNKSMVEFFNTMFKRW